MSEVADQYIRLGATIKQGIEGLGQRAVQDANMRLQETEMMGRLNDPRRKLAMAEAEDELAVRGQAFDPRGLVGQPPLAGGVAGPPQAPEMDYGAEQGNEMPPTPMGPDGKPMSKRQMEEAVKQQAQARANTQKIVKGVVGNNPHHQIHFANTLYPELNRKFGWTFGKDGNLYSRTGRVLTNEDFNRSGARLMLKAYSDPMKYIEGEVAMIDQQMAGIDPNIPANQKTIEDLQARKVKLNDVHGRMKENPAGVAKMKYDAILKLAHHVPNNADFTYEIDRARLDYTKALETEIRSGKVDPNEYYRVSMYTQDKDGYKTKHLYIPKINPDGTPNVFDEGHPEFKKENIGGKWLAGIPSADKDNTVKQQTVNQRYSIVNRFYAEAEKKIAERVKSLDPNLKMSAKDAKMFTEMAKRHRQTENWRISQGLPTAMERGIELDNYGFFEGEVAKGKDGKEYRYEGADTWVPLQGKGFFERNPKSGKFEEQSEANDAMADAFS